jgi:hypothetical protein
MSNDKKNTDKFPRKMLLPDGTVFTAYGVRTTSAPPPIKPMGASATVRSSAPPTTHRPAVAVDWAFWPASRRVKQDEAIALSLDLDPHSLYSNIDGHINPEFCPDNATAILYLKRLSLLAACNSRTNILLSEFSAWAVSVGMTPLPNELVARTHAQGRHQPDTTANNKVTCDCAELALNGYQIAWDYWRGRKQITPQQAAELAHCVEPDKGKVPKELSIHIQRLAESLAEHSPTWTLSALVKHLGDEVPFNMKQVVASGNAAPAKVGAVDSPIPGKLPNISVGKLAIEVAWLLEQETHRAATAQEVMKQLQAWADDGSKPEVLLKSAKAKHGVEWRTKGGKPKIYDSEACGKALATWMKSRA